MKISINELRYYQRQYNWSPDPAPHGVEDLVRKIGVQLGAVEETIDFGTRFKGVLIVKIVSCHRHADADKLHVCKIDDGGKAKGVERDENGHVQVVCGAPNVREGLGVAWLPPGSTVPSTFGDNEFVLETRPFRGVVSNGMLASPKELSIGDNHDGILEVDQEVAPGTPFAEAYNLEGDVVIDIENKMFTHRPDCFGWIGVAREIAGIQHQPFTSPDWYVANPTVPDIETDGLPLDVQNELPELVPRFTAITMRDVQVGPSPLWLQISLARMGARPINNIVDYTNYFMLLTGQPLHAYDYDKVAARSDGGATIVVRKPRGQEVLSLLNGKDVTFDQKEHDDILIATNKELIGLGGVMGGADTEVDDDTKNIILECANFDMYAIRRTSMKWGLFTDAVTRFNKGQSPLQNPAVIAKIVDEIRTHAGGKVASRLIDDCHIAPRALHSGSLHPAVTVSRHFINSRLGLDLSLKEMTTLLANVEFAVTHDSDNLVVTAPFWRTDIAIAEDIVEEIGRLYGYDHLPLELPKRSLVPLDKDAAFGLKGRIRTILANAGANEVLTYSFVHGDLLDKVGQRRDQAFQLSNALSPDLQYFRMSLMPSLLEKVHPNIKAGYDEFALFEMNKTHNLLHPPKAGEAPPEFASLSLVAVAGDKTATKYAGAPYYLARTYLDYLGERLGVTFEYAPLKDSIDLPVFKPYETSRSAMVQISGGEPLGIIGEFRPLVTKKLKLPRFAAGFDLSLEALPGYLTQDTRYAQLLRYPSTEQDLCFKVNADVTYAVLFNAVRAAFNAHTELRTTLKPLDIYQRSDDSKHTQITVRATLQHPDKTLTTAEVNQVLEQVVAEVAKKTGAERV